MTVEMFSDKKFPTHAPEFFGVVFGGLCVFELLVSWSACSWRSLTLEIVALLHSGSFYWASTIFSPPTVEAGGLLMAFGEAINKVIFICHLLLISVAWVLPYMGIIKCRWAEPFRTSEMNSARLCKWNKSVNELWKFILKDQNQD